MNLQHAGIDPAGVAGGHDLPAHGGPAGLALWQAFGPCILVGDRNCTPWSARFQCLTARTGLHDARLGRGVAPTWSPRVLPWLIPIDRSLLASDWQVRDWRRGSPVECDRHPVVVELALPLAR